MATELSADEIIARLGLVPHPEGGSYRETYRDSPRRGGRGACTAIYFLLRAGEISAWHRIADAAEIWHHYAGDPLALSISTDGHQVTTLVLGSALERGEEPQAVVPAAAWQSARSLGAWSLAGCTVAPAFELSSFELAPPGWQPAP
ncbi:MAG TPA: cupin domain-containing protein [Thermoanaerobaculia bacterium]|nr:cupin domain-containing protein [Thermoanaerobaculia bacterium]